MPYGRSLAACSRKCLRVQNACRKCLPRDKPLTPSRAPSVHIIGVENPGPWVLHHHKDNFITEIRKPVEFKSAYDKAEHQLKEWIGESARWAERRLGIKGGKKDQSQEEKDADRGEWE